MANDLINRQAAIDAMTNTLWHYPNECYRNLNEYEFAKGLAELGLKSVPSVQPEQPERPSGRTVYQAGYAEGYKAGQQERKTGKWINAYPDIEPNPMLMYGICSVCGFEQSISDKLQYCPSCGARMVQEGEDNGQTN